MYRITTSFVAKPTTCTANLKKEYGLLLDSICTPSLIEFEISSFSKLRQCMKD